MNVAAVFRRQGSSNAWKDNSPVPTPSVSIIEGSVSNLLDENGREGKSRDGVPLSAVEDAFVRKERAGVVFALSTTPPPIAPLRYFYTLTDYSSCLTDLLVPRRAYSHSAAQGQFHGAFATASAVATLLTTVATCQQMNLPLETSLSNSRRSRSNLRSRLSSTAGSSAMPTHRPKAGTIRAISLIYPYVTPTPHAWSTYIYYYDLNLCLHLYLLHVVSSDRIMTGGQGSGWFGIARGRLSCLS